MNKICRVPASNYIHKCLFNSTSYLKILFNLFIIYYYRIYYVDNLLSSSTRISLYQRVSHAMRGR